jgi:hypothetical protein
MAEPEKLVREPETLVQEPLAHEKKRSESIGITFATLSGSDGRGGVSFRGRSAPLYG